MEKFFANSEEKYLKSVMTYSNAEDGILYFDSDKTVKVSKEELIDMFNKGIIVIHDGNNNIRPTTLMVADNYATVSYTAVNSSAAVTISYHSDGYVAG